MRLGSNTSVYGLFGDEQTVEQVCQSLTAAGFRAEDTAVMLARNSGNMDFGLERRTRTTDGMAMGMPLGLLAGALACEAFTRLGGPFTVRMLDGLPAWVAVFTGSAICGLLGFVVGGLWGFGIPKFNATRYAGRKRQVGMLVSVHCDDRSWCLKAKDIFEAHGALDVSFHREARPDFQGSERPYPLPAADRYTHV